MDAHNLEPMANAIWETARGTLLRVIVRPNSKEKDLIAHITPEAIIVNLKGPAREGKANTELIKRISKMLKTSTSEISLVAGHKNKEKTLLIARMSAEELTKRLSRVT